MKRSLIGMDYSTHDMQVWAHVFITELSDKELQIDRGEIDDSIGFNILSK